MQSERYRLTMDDNVLVICSDETLLQCACNNHIDLNYRCAAGYCGCCKVKLVSGQVFLDHSGGISREEIDSGFILACCAYPRSDVAIEMEG